MGGRNRPLTCTEVKKILKNLGFSRRTQRGSHEQWVKTENGRLYKVTVDCPKQPFSQNLIKYMSAQAGVSKREFYNALNKKKGG